MKNILKKEFLLAMHPTAIIFLLLSAMLLIPNYPYYIIFFYTGLAVFFTCLNGRENNDVFYTMTLPIPKRHIVKARFTLVILLEMLQIIIAIPFAVLRQNMFSIGNQAGMDANITLFGLSFIMLGLFNYVFFSIYYKNVNKVGKAFVTSSVIVFFYIVIAEVCAHTVPFFKDYLDTKDTLYLGYKTIVLGVGMIIYAILTYLAYIKSVKNFEKLDI